MSLLPGYFQHSTFYHILVILLMDGSVADRSMSCTQLSNPKETTVFRDDGCFLLSRVTRTWEESDTFCKDLGSGWSLVVIEDAETQRHVDNLTLTAGVSSESWIGLHRQGNKYTWVSGNPLKYGGFFRDLRQGETTSTLGCVTTSPPVDTKYGTWNNVECTTRLSTICHTTTSSRHRTTAAARQTTTSTATSTTTSTSTSTPTSTTSSTTTSTPTSTITSTSTSTPTSTTSSTTTVNETPAKVLIPVTSGVAVVAAVAVVGVVIILCRRNKAKLLRVRTFDTDAGDDRESGDTYDRAMFRQSGDDVHNYTSLTRKSPHAHDTSIYIHAIVQ